MYNVILVADGQLACSVGEYRSPGAAGRCLACFSRFVLSCFRSGQLGLTLAVNVFAKTGQCAALHLTLRGRVLIYNAYGNGHSLLDECHY